MRLPWHSFENEPSLLNHWMKATYYREESIIIKLGYSLVFFLRLLRKYHTIITNKRHDYDEKTTFTS